MLIVDYETQAIDGNTTVNPPEPVGVAIKRPGYKSRYFSWGHPSHNNCENPGKAQAIIARHIEDGDDLLFHNAKFDLAVQTDWLDLPQIDPLKVHDSMYLVALADPYADTFSLKPSAERLLDWPAEERDMLQEWIMQNVRPAKPTQWGAHIADAPGNIVAPYARGDTDRTWGLYEALIKTVPTEPYQREQRLLPIIMESERRGVRLDMEWLESDLHNYELALEKCNRVIYKILGSNSINLDSGTELAAALDKRNLVTRWVLTPTGRRSTAREALMSGISHPKLAKLLAYRGALAHCLSTFMRPWVELGNEYHGRLHPEWNQVRQARDAKKSKGTRTNRLSCMRPNLMAISNEYDLVVPAGYPDMPVMREYMLPDEGYVWLKRDYSQQEMRILAHFSEGRLFERYKANPHIDAHTETASLILEHAGLDLPRKPVKTVGFSILFGSGIPHLSEGLGVSMDEAAGIKGAYMFALPEIQELSDDCKDRGNAGLAITTWGGREYYVEPPKIIGNRYRNFAYKLINYLIQGSGADCTKEAIIRWSEDPGDGEFLLTVHDEIDGQAPIETAPKDMEKLRLAMESIEFDVEMLSDGFMGESWGDLEECK